MKNALSIDLEDWFHPELIRKKITGNIVPQIEESIHFTLDLLKKYDKKATFFILGACAKENPNLIKEIAAQGHEIAFHSMNHIPLWDLTETQFLAELDEFQEIMENILGKDFRPKGFRAPTFSINNDTKYSLACLEQKGYLYDSSVFPVKTFLYGMQNAPIDIYQPNQEDISKKNEKFVKGKIMEFPMSVLKIGPFRIPVSGGFYLRLIPYFILKLILKFINKSRPFVIYFHPWEIYEKTPRVNKIGIKNRFITYYGLKSASKKIEKLLKDFEFAPMNNFIIDLQHNYI